MHREAFSFVASRVPSLTMPDGAVIEIGARDINGSVRGLFPGRPYIGVDCLPGNGVDVVAPGESFTPDEPAAVVVCTETLEHTANGKDICENAHAILKAGGVFLVTAAGPNRTPHSAIEGGPLRDGEYYGNVSRENLSAWLSEFASVDIVEDPAVGDIYAVAVKAHRRKKAR